MLVTFSLHHSTPSRSTRASTQNQLTHAHNSADCKVRIWDMNCVYKEEEKLPDRLLSTVGHHNGAVNCVRWSHCG